MLYVRARTLLLGVAVGWLSAVVIFFLRHYTITQDPTTPIIVVVDSYGIRIPGPFDCSDSSFGLRSDGRLSGVPLTFATSFGLGGPPYAFEGRKTAAQQCRLNLFLETEKLADLLSAQYEAEWRQVAAGPGLLEKVFYRNLLPHSNTCSSYFVRGDGNIEIEGCSMRATLIAAPEGVYDSQGNRLIEFLRPHPHSSHSAILNSEAIDRFINDT